MNVLASESLKALLAANTNVLCSTQAPPVLSYTIISRIFQKILAGIQFQGTHIAEGFVVDGHHRYIASLLSNYSLEKYPSVLGSSGFATDWDNVIFEETDWDTPAKISTLNKEDTRYSNVLVAHLERFLA